MTYDIVYVGNDAKTHETEITVPNFSAKNFSALAVNFIAAGLDDKEIRAILSIKARGL